MSIDYSVHLSCDVKLKLGDGDALAGEGDLLRRLKANGRAKTLRKIAKQQGKPVETMWAVVNETDDEGEPQKFEVRYTDLMREIEPLAPLQSACAACPANALQRPFGCQGDVKYPIRKTSEQWLMDQVQALDTVAGPYLVAAFAEDDEGHAQIQQMRERGLLESSEAVNKVVGVKGKSKIEIGSTDVLETFLGRGDLLEPNYCLMLLLGLGAVTVDGRPATSTEGFSAVLEMEECDERQERTGFAFGPDPDPGIVGVQALLRAMYFAWRNDVPFLISV
jgi:hypothetical protein